MKIRLAVLACCFAMSSPAWAQEADVLRTANVSVMAEAALATVAMIDRRVEGRISSWQWNARLSRREWRISITAAGERSGGLELLGFTWTENGGDLVTTYAGWGEAEGEPVRVYGHASWPFDSDRRDYVDMQFRQATAFGENSWWTWTVGAEVVLGAVAGGWGGVITVPVTGPGAIAVGLLGALGGAEAAATLSNTVRSALAEEEEGPPEPPPLPDPPPLPSVEPGEPGVNIPVPSDRSGNLVIVVSRSGFEGEDFDAGWHISGKLETPTQLYGTITRLR